MCLIGTRASIEAFSELLERYEELQNEIEELRDRLDENDREKAVRKALDEEHY